MLDRHYAFISSIQDFNFVDRIILFGSRARGDAFDRSDIDLAIVCPKATEQEWLKVIDIIEDADTLLKIDCVRLDSLPSGSKLRANIIKDGKILYDKN